MSTPTEEVKLVKKVFRAWPKTKNGDQLGRKLSSKTYFEAVLADPEAESEHILYATEKLVQLLRPESRVMRFCPKVKLHGTNAAINRYDGGVVAQSRNNFKDHDNPHMGFEDFVARHEKALMNLKPGIVLYGEWCGKGVQAKVAVSEVPKFWAVFAAVDYSDPDNPTVEYRPSKLHSLLASCGLGQLHDPFIISWHDLAYTVDMLSPESIRIFRESASQLTAWVDAQCPFAHKQFGVVGVGEGLVYYPVPPEETPAFAMPLSYLTEHFFKSKGVAHKRTAGEKQKIQKERAKALVEQIGAQRLEELVRKCASPARLEQGRVEIMGGCDVVPVKEKTGFFLKWVMTDICAEEYPAIAAEGIPTKELGRIVSQVARDWWFEESQKVLGVE